MKTERIALGTAQFGLPYGIANTTGRITPGAIPSILNDARRAGVDTLDTAIAYGDAETRLGDAGVTGFRVVTKLPPLPEGLAGARAIEAFVTRHVAGSLARLGVDRLHALLLHRAADLTGPSGAALAAAMVAARDAGLTDGVGVSVYAPADLEATEGRLPWSVVQLPCSVVDRRFIHSGWIARLHDAGVEVHARSIFLQGVLLMPTDRRPGFFARWAPLWREWDQWQRVTGQSALQACLAFALSVPGLSRLVIGIDGPEHLRDILAAVSSPLTARTPALGSDDPDLLEPTRWSALRESHGP